VRTFYTVKILSSQKIIRSLEGIDNKKPWHHGFAGTKVIAITICIRMSKNQPAHNLKTVNQMMMGHS
jgi:hypothetical protein